MPPPALTFAQKSLAAVLLAVLLVPLVPSAIYGLRAAWVNADTVAARRIVMGWREGYGPGYTTERWQDTFTALEQGTHIDPDNAQLYADLGYLFVIQANTFSTAAQSDPTLAELRWLLLDSAIENLRRATQLRPRFPYGWGHLAGIKSLRGQADAEMWGAFDKALDLGRNEGGTQLAIAEVAFAHWGTLTPQRRARVDQMLQHPNAQVYKDILEIAQRNGVALPTP